MPEAAAFALEQLEPSQPPPRDAAERELASARLEAAQLRERARAEGFEQGHAEGMEAARTELGTAGAALSAAFAEVAAMRERVADDVEREAVELALALAGKIVASALQVRPELVVESVQGALRRVSGERTIRLVLNPADVETVRRALGDLQAAGERWDLEADQRVPAGGAIVRTAESEVDARIEVQLERAREVVAKELGAPALPGHAAGEAAHAGAADCDGAREGAVETRGTAVDAGDDDPERTLEPHGTAAPPGDGATEDGEGA